MKVVLSIPQKKVTHQSSILTSKALSSQWLLFPYPSLTFRPNPSHRRCPFVSLRLLAPPSTLHLYFSGKKKKNKTSSKPWPILVHRSPIFVSLEPLLTSNRCSGGLQPLPPPCKSLFSAILLQFSSFFFHPSLLHLLPHVYNPRPSRPLFH